jgi:competence protein ComEC
MRRPLLALAALFAAGCLAADTGAGTAEAVALGLLALTLLALAFAARPSAAARALGAAAFALGALAAQVEALWFERGSLRQGLISESWGPEPVGLSGSVRGDARPREGRLPLVLDVQEVRVRGRTERRRGRVRLEVGGQTALPSLTDGDRVTVWAALRPEERSRGVRKGIVARGYCKTALLLERHEEGGAGSIRTLTARVRARLRATLMTALLPGPERGLVLAMVLGDRSELDEPTAEAFRASGTYHVLALSGAQVALVAGLIVGGLRRLRVGPGPEAVLASTAIWFYALLVGGDVPIVRAALMASAVLAGRAFDLAGDAANTLGLAALVLLVLRPAHAWDVGFQLSFGATLGILLLVGPLGRGVPALPLRADLALVASVAAQAVLSPLLALQFHRLAPGALLLNLAAVPLSGAVLLAGLGTIALSPVPLVGRLVADLAWIAAHALRRSGDLGALGPWLDVRVAAPTLVVVGIHVAALTLLARGHRRRGLGLLLVSHLGLLAGPPPLTGDGRLHLSVLDVGQGDCLLLRSPAGRALLIDTGGSWSPRFDVGERRVAPVLWRSGVHRVDAILLTHGHGDHVGGAPFLLRHFVVGEVWAGPAPVGSPGWQRLDRVLRGADVGRRALARGVALEWDGVELRVLGPPAPDRPPRRPRNEDSVVLVARIGGVTFLLPGDVEGAAEDRLVLPPSVVVKVPHHGSRTSSRPPLVRFARPRLAVASLGARNPFGYPHPEVVRRYREAGALFLRTDRDGQVDVATDGTRVWVRAAGEALERRIR